ncbi:MAG: hypothetical protein LC649_06095 [Bacteroidales bacterium]|nr:hypothetical protein [Bacteroidales bacterium]
MYSENLKVFRNNPLEGILNRTVFFRYLLTGFFTGLFHIIIHALFLNRFEVSDLALAYAVAGVLSIILLPLYSLIPFQRQGLKNLTLIVPSLALLLSVAVCLLLRGEAGERKIFISFLFLLPLWLLLLADAERVFRAELLSDRPAGRLRGVADTTMIAGFLASALIVPGFISLGVRPETILLLLPLTALLIIAFQLGQRPGKERDQHSGNFTDNDGIKHTVDGETGETSRTGNYLSSWISYYGLSMGITFIFFFLFIAAADIRYRELLRLINFLAFYEVVVMVSTLLIRSFLVPAIQRSGSIKILLLLTPATLLFLLLVTLSAGLGDPLTLEFFATGPLLLFVMMAALAVISRSLLVALLIPLEGLFRRVRDGSRKIFAARVMRHLVTAGIIAVISLLFLLVPVIGEPGNKAVVIVSLLIPVALLRIAFMLRRDYRGSLKKMTQAGGDITCDPVSKEEKFCRTFYDFVHFNDPAILLSGDEPGELWDDKRFSVISIRRALSHWRYAALPLLHKLSFIGESSLEKLAAEAITAIERDSDNTWSKIASRQQYGQDRIVRGSEKKVYPLVNSQNIVLTDLIRLMRDPDPRTRRVAILIAGRDKLYDLIPDLCDALLIDRLSREAFSVLKQFGERAFRSLAALYARSATPVRVRVLIIRLFAATKTNDGAEFLAEAFFSVHREVRKEALKGLLGCNYRPDRQMRERLQVEADRVIDIIAWNTSAAATFTTAGDYEMADFIGTDSEWWYRYLFGVISLIYGKNGVAMVCDSINRSDGGSYAEARELIDIIVDQPLKKRLLILISVLSGRSSPARLILNAGLEMLPYRQLCATMINMDYNQVSVWTRSCALRRLYDIPEFTDFRSVAALLFSPYELLREEAARFLREKRVVVFNNTVDRIPDNYRSHLEDVVRERVPEGDELFYKTNMLRFCFPQVNPSDLLSLAAGTIRVNLATVTGDDEKEPCIVIIYGTGDESKCSAAVEWRDYGTDELTPEMYGGGESFAVYALRIENVAREVFRNPELDYTLIPALAGLMEKSTGNNEKKLTGGEL